MLPDCGLQKPPPNCRVNVTLPWNSEQSLETFVFNLLYVAVSLLGGSIVLVGILSSILCVLVFSRNHITLRTTRRLLILNFITDVLYLSFLGCPTILIGLYRKDSVSNLARDCFYTMANVVQIFRNWTITIIALERVLLLCYPIYFKFYWNLKRVTHLVYVVGTLSAFLRTNTVLTLVYKYNGLCSIAAKLFSLDALIDVVFLTFLPLILLSFISVRIFVEIQRVQQWRYSLNSMHRKGELNYRHFEARIHRTLLMVLVLFTILSIPYFPNGVLRVLQAMRIGGCQVYLWQRITSVAAYTGTLLNSTVNCFVYLICWPRFRHIVWRTLTSPLKSCFACLQKQ
ncbi:unnamed protein product [Rodentolepis nana]|uniref:G_PROTEIN_RECEP_F1_2 domain-containing protein n=1 Tax=Rodentolepis nana TaxID=102285 RepID=A0A0R3T9I2_RODNA|nr:unnamed protein product [Rodentolepis nana]